jgi:hypothetical protein
MSFPSVPTILFVTKKRYSSTTKTDEIFHRNFAREYGITFAAEVSSNNKKTFIFAVNNAISNVNRTETFPSVEGRSGLRPSQMTPRYFVRIFFHLR